ncbi:MULTISPECIES: hypothetical protein [unclassified Luteococcus]|uniref:hypothetical protein n=1 Tax=unclassified Luteococcus TaxID=2639923 RepID=UPI00313CE4DB
MANLTISVHPDVLRRARIKALQRDESVNAWLARQLEVYAGDDAADAMSDLLVMARSRTAAAGEEPYVWRREDGLR